MSLDNLTATEQKLLVAVFRQMTEVPEVSTLNFHANTERAIILGVLRVSKVNYQKVADEVGTNYGKNSKAVFQKLFEKIRGDTGMKITSAGDHEGEPAKKKARVVQKKGIARPVAKSNVNRKVLHTIKEEDEEESSYFDHMDDDDDDVDDDPQGMTPGALYRALGVKTTDGGSPMHES